MGTASLKESDCLLCRCGLFEGMFDVGTRGDVCEQPIVLSNDLLVMLDCLCALRVLAVHVGPMCVDVANAIDALAKIGP